MSEESPVYSKYTSARPNDCDDCVDQIPTFCFDLNLKSPQSISCSAMVLLESGESGRWCNTFFYLGRKGLLLARIHDCLVPAQGFLRCNEAGPRMLRQGRTREKSMCAFGSQEWLLQFSFGRSHTNPCPFTGCFIASGLPWEGNIHWWNFTCALNTLSFPMTEKMFELNTRGQRIEAYANAHETVTVCNTIATYDLTLCLDQKECILGHQRDCNGGWSEQSFCSLSLSESQN